LCDPQVWLSDLQSGMVKTLQTQLSKVHTSTLPTPLHTSTLSTQVWLSDLQNGMVKTLQTQLSKVQSGSMQGEFKAAASQILCLKEAVNFTARWCLLQGL
jgi:hypothetical protein